MATQNTTGKLKSAGTCTFCGKKYAKGGMSRHLAACNARKDAQAHAASRRRAQPQKLFHIVVSGYDVPDYWMHVEVPAKMLLSELDHFLRGIWLECCGHLSMFRINDQAYSVSPMVEFGDKSMAVSLGQVLQPGTKFYHEYDFGTTTRLLLHVVSGSEGVIRKDKLDIMARNDPPPIMCYACGENLATVVCSVCIWEGAGAWYCDACSSQHDCDDDYFLPVVNSPRVGMCGYTG